MRTILFSFLFILLATLLSAAPAYAANHFLGDFTTGAVPGMAAGSVVEKAGFVIVSSQSTNLGEIAQALETTAEK